MKDPEKELIEEIVSLFEDYEEAYVPGEWEAFVQQRAKKNISAALLDPHCRRAGDDIFCFAFCGK